MPVGAALMLWVGVLQIVLDVRAWLGPESCRISPPMAIPTLDI